MTNLMSQMTNLPFPFLHPLLTLHDCKLKKYIPIPFKASIMFQHDLPRADSTLCRLRKVVIGHVTCSGRNLLQPSLVPVGRGFLKAFFPGISNLFKQVYLHCTSQIGLGLIISNKKESVAILLHNFL